MARLNHGEFVTFFLALGMLLASARVLGEAARRFGFPTVFGEMVAGLMLGPTVLGALAPQWSQQLFPLAGGVPHALHGLTTLAVVMFLLVAGMEVDLSSIWKQGRTAIVVSLAGILAPMAVGFAAGWFAPSAMGREADVSRGVFALFLATALSITALPLVAKTLMDLDLYKSDLGMVVVAAAVFNDLVGWVVFSVLLSLMPRPDGMRMELATTLVCTVLFVGLLLTVGRRLIDRVLPWVQAHTSWPGGVLGFSMALALFGAAFTEWMGLHAVFGAFLVGVAIGDSAHLREQTRQTIHEFVSFIFAPLYFASIGLNVDFVRSFDAALVGWVLLIACLGKILGCGWAARWAGMPPREAWSVGFAMNGRGAMEIILGTLALQHGLIGERLFVALVVMAVATSLLSGPIMRRILRRRIPRRLADAIAPRTFVRPVTAASAAEVIQVLSRVAADAAGLPEDVVLESVRAREEMAPTGLEHGVAVPHARLDGLGAPVVAVGVAPNGVDFNSPDGEPARLVFLILTPLSDFGAQIELLADIAARCRQPETRAALLAAPSYTQFLAVLRTSPTSRQAPAGHAGIGPLEVGRHEG